MQCRIKKPKRVKLTRYLSASWRLPAWILPALIATIAYSCPLCHTPAGEQVRAGIWNDHFLLRATATLSPFPVFGGVVGYLYFVKPKAKR